MLAADAVVTLAETMRSDIVARGVPAERVFIVPNGVDPDAFRPRPADPALRERYGLGERFVIGYVSNLDHPREGQETLIEATAILAAAGRDVACLIVGEGRRRAELESIAAASGAADRIVFTGAVPHAEVPAMYALMDAFVVPRRDERAARLVTPLKPFEAMAMARPLIVADLPALTEVAPDGERSLAYRAEDAGALAAAVGRLMDDPALAARLGEAGRAWVTRERTWAANGPRWTEIYEHVLAARERRRSSTRSGDRAMNLVLRGVAADAAAAALATTAALRALDAVGVGGARGLDRPWHAPGSMRRAAWDHGIALVRVSGPGSGGIRSWRSRTPSGHGSCRAPRTSAASASRAGDGARLAARHELGLWPDEEVEVVLGADRHPAALRRDSEAFDERLAAEPEIPRRLVLAGLTGHGPALSEPMIRAILHPLTLVEVTPSDQATLDLIREAAAVVPLTG